MAMTISVERHGHKFLMVCGDRGYIGSGVIVPLDADVSSKTFKRALSKAMADYPYIEAYYYFVEYGDWVLHQETMHDDEDLVLALEAVQKGIVSADAPMIELLNKIKYGAFQKRPTTKYERKPIAGHVYLIKSSEGVYKIGKAVSVKDRMKSFGITLPFDIELIHTIDTSDYTKLELELHERFAAKRLRGEWFTLSPEDVEYIKGL